MTPKECQDLIYKALDESVIEYTIGETEGILFTPENIFPDGLLSIREERMRTMNLFMKVSEEEYSKVVNSQFNAKNRVQSYFAYDELIIPHRATKGSAGYDFHSPISFCLKSGETMKIPTGIKCKLDNGLVLILFPRSSYGFKYRMQLDNTVGIVDEDYFDNPDNEGHIYIKITNDSKSNQNLVVNKGDAFAQGIILRYETAYEDYVDVSRIGGIGSTSKNQFMLL